MDDRGLPAVRGLSLEVRAGEIVGIAGRRRQRPVRAGGGDLRAAGADRRAASASAAATSRGTGVRGALAAGVGHIAEDRHRRGLVLDFSLAENMAMRAYRRDRPPRPAVAQAHARTAARPLLEEYDVRGGRPEVLASSLSGGNQQKVVIAREIAEEPRVLLAAQPTRGLDVGAIEFVHRRLLEQRAAGTGRAARLARAGGDPRAGRPRAGALRGPDRGRAAARRHRRGAGRRHDGRRPRRRRGPRERPVAGRRRRRHGRLAAVGLPARRRHARAGDHRARGLRRRGPVHDRGRGGPARDLQRDPHGQRAELVLPLDLRGGPHARGAQPAADAAAHGAAHPRRPRRGVRLPRRPVQHRRPGPVHRRLGRRRLGRLVVRGHARASCTSCWRSSSPRSRARSGPASRGSSRRPPAPTRSSRPSCSTTRRSGSACTCSRSAARCRATSSAPSRSRTTSSSPRACRCSGATRSCRACTSASSSRVAALLVFWVLLNRSVTGFEVRAVGFNPDAAEYGGISAARNYVKVMAICGAFAGLAGALDILGWQFRLNRNDIEGSDDRVPRHRGRAAGPQHRAGHRRRRAALRRAGQRHVRAQPRSRGVRPAAGDEPHHRSSRASSSCSSARPSSCRLVWNLRRRLVPGRRGQKAEAG